jgi:hypothetical protein
MRAKMFVRSKEMRLMRASKLREVPKSTLKDNVNKKEQYAKKNQSVLEVIASLSYVKQILGRFLGRGYVGEIWNIVFLISHTLPYSLFLK